MQIKLLLLYKIAYKNYINTNIIKYIWNILEKDSVNIIINRWYNYLKYCNIDIVSYILIYNKNNNKLNEKKKEKILSIIFTNLSINIANRNISSILWWVKNLLKIKKNVKKVYDKKKIDNLIDKIIKMD